MQSADRYKNVSKLLVYKWHADLEMGLQRRPPCKDKKQTLTVKNAFESDRRSSCQCRLQQVYCSARFTCRPGYFARIS